MLPEILLYLSHLVSRNAASGIVVARASKVRSHRGQLAGDCVEHRDRQIDKLAELRGKSTSKCLVNQTHCVRGGLLVQVAIGEVGREVPAQEVPRSNVATKLDGLQARQHRLL